MHGHTNIKYVDVYFNPLNAELNPIYHLLALLGSDPILHVSRVRVKSNNMVQSTHNNYFSPP